MKRQDIFISQTEGRSREVAKALRIWLRDEMKLGDPCISEDVGDDEDWGEKSEKALEEACFGIICVSDDNLTDEWITNEARVMRKNRVRFFLYYLDPAPEHLPTSLRQRQLQVKLANREGTASLVRAANRALGNRLGDVTLETAFNRTWEGLEVSLEGIRNPLPAVGEYEELVAEFLQLVMDINKYRKNLHFAPVVDNALYLFEEGDYKRREFVRYVYAMIEEGREEYDRDSRLVGNVREFFREQFKEEHLRERIIKLEPFLRSKNPPDTKRDLLLKHAKAEELKVYLLLYQALVDELKDKLRSLSACQPQPARPSGPKRQTSGPLVLHFLSWR